MPKQARDVYATLASHPADTHPFAVFIRYADGSASQELLCRDLRDCLLVGNGMLAVLLATDSRGGACEVNVVFDPRFAH